MKHRMKITTGSHRWWEHLFPVEVAYMSNVLYVCFGRSLVAVCGCQLQVCYFEICVLWNYSKLCGWFCCCAVTFVRPKAHTHKHTGDCCFMPRCSPQGNHRAVTHTGHRYILTHTPCLPLLTLHRLTDRQVIIRTVYYLPVRESSSYIPVVFSILVAHLGKTTWFSGKNWIDPNWFSLEEKKNKLIKFNFSHLLLMVWTRFQGNT